MGYLGDSRAAPVHNTIQDALARIAASPKAAGILATDHDTALQYRDWGAQFLAVGIDVVMLAQAARSTMARWRDG
jgi:4-hydroxy-2-oxoheptanedioate aldolase